MPVVQNYLSRHKFHRYEISPISGALINVRVHQNKIFVEYCRLDILLYLYLVDLVFVDFAIGATLYNTF